MIRPALFALLLTGWSAAAPYTDAKSGFSVTPPAGWQKGSYPGTTLVYLSPKPVGEFTPNVNVVVQNLPKGMTQAQYHQISVAQITKVITDGRILSNRAVMLGGQPANEVAYTGRQGQFALSFLATYAVRGGKAYVVTFTTLKGQEAGVKPQAAAFVKSFRFTR